MPQEPARPAAGRRSAEQVRARVAATNQFLVRSRLRASQAMAQVRYVDRLLHGTSQRSDAAEQAEGTGSEHLIEVIEHEVAAHVRALTLHEAAAQLQEDAGWPERAAAARFHAAHARELSRRAREELARHRARAAAAQQQVDKLHGRSPEGGAALQDPGAEHDRP